MPRTTGVDILSIKPDADLGLSQDSNIPVPAVAMEQVNKANQDLRDFDHQKQLMKYDNDLKNQDRLLKGLAEDAVSAGAILPEDMDAFKKSEAADRLAFLSVKREPDKNGQNKEYDNYVRTHQNHKDFATNAQAKYIAIQKLRQQLADETVPEEQEKLKKWIDTEKKRPVGDPVRPYQKALTTDIDGMVSRLSDGAVVQNGVPVNTQSTTTKTKTGPKGTVVETTTAPNKIGAAKSGKGNAATSGELTPDGKLPVYTQEPDTVVDFNKIYRNADQAFRFDPAMSARMKATLDLMQHGTADEIKNSIKTYNDAIASASQKLGVPSIKVPGVTGTPDPNNPGSIVGREIDTHEYPHQIHFREVGDKVVIQDSVPMLAAKITFANLADHIKKGGQGIDKEAYKLNLEADKIKADLLKDKNATALKWAEFGLDKKYKNWQMNKPKNESSAASAAAYAQAFMSKLPTITDANGNVDLSKLSDEELKYLGTGARENNSFTLSPLDVSKGTKLSFKDGQLSVLTPIRNDKKEITGYEQKPGSNIDIKKIAGNRLMEEVTSSTGKEGIEWNSLIPLYKESQTGSSASTYSWNGNDYSEDEIKQGAAAEKLSVDAYTKKHGIKKK